MTILSYVSAEADLSVGYVYKWTNLVNGMMYIGSHNGSDPYYVGSGTYFLRAYKKYGKENFQREFLYVGPDFFKVETEILQSIDASHSSRFYNSTNNERDQDKDTSALSDETRELLSQISLDLFANDEFRTRHLEGIHTFREIAGNPGLFALWAEKYTPEEIEIKTLQWKEKISGENHYMHQQGLVGENHPHYGKKRSQETKDRISYKQHLLHHPSKNKPRKPCQWCEGRTAPI
jgi:hypothetical protein